MCHPTEAFADPIGLATGRRAGLLWIGHGHYPTPVNFSAEVRELGISRRITNIPKGFKVGSTWVFLAHRKCNFNDGGVFDQHIKPGIFSAFLPRRIEMLVRQMDFDRWELVSKYISTEKLDYELDRVRIMKKSPFSEQTRRVWNKMRKDFERGITFVPVPDNDKDHQ
jgi:hypothetical protein